MRFNIVPLFLALWLLLPEAGAEIHEMPTKDQLARWMPTLNDKIKNNPRDWESLCSRGFCDQELGYPANAIADFSAAIVINPNCREAYNGRFVTYMSLKQYDKAMKDCDALIALNPTSDALSNRGVVFLVTENLPKALADFQHALQLNPRNAGAYDNMGIVYYKQKKYKEAIAACTKAISLLPTAAEAFYYRGKSYEALKQMDLAKPDLDAASNKGYKPEAGEIIHSEEH